MCRAAFLAGHVVQITLSILRNRISGPRLRFAAQQTTRCDERKLVVRLRLRHRVSYFLRYRIAASWPIKALPSKCQPVWHLIVFEIIGSLSIIACQFLSTTTASISYSLGNLHISFPDPDLDSKSTNGKARSNSCSATTSLPTFNQTAQDWISNLSTTQRTPASTIRSLWGRLKWQGKLINQPVGY